MASWQQALMIIMLATLALATMTTLGLYCIAQRVWPGARALSARCRGRRRTRRPAEQGLPV